MRVAMPPASTTSATRPASSSARPSASSSACSREPASGSSAMSPGSGGVTRPRTTLSSGAPERSRADSARKRSASKPVRSSLSRTAAGTLARRSSAFSDIGARQGSPLLRATNAICLEPSRRTVSALHGVGTAPSRPRGCFLGRARAANATLPAMRFRRVGSVLLVGAVLLGLAPSIGAQAPVLHEFIEPRPDEDLELGATTPDGRMPAAVRTPSGVISAPGFAGQNPARQVAYGGSSTPDSIDATYRIDRDTTQPASVDYDDPFTPSVAPFKRLYAFDAVDPELELVVRDKGTRPVRVGGTLRSGDDHFFGDLFV